jgi:hypothetical protein
MIKRFIKQIVEEYDEKGVLLRKETIETTEEDDNTYGYALEAYTPTEEEVRPS